MAAEAILKNHKNRDITTTGCRSWRNLARLCNIGLLTPDRQKIEFPQSKMADGRISKTVKLPYLRNRLTDFGEIWHGDADWLPTGDRLLKF